MGRPSSENLPPNHSQLEIIPLSSPLFMFLVESKQEYIEGFIPAIVTMLLPYSDAITRTQDTGDPAIIPGYL